VIEELPPEGADYPLHIRRLPGVDGFLIPRDSGGKRGGRPDCDANEEAKMLAWVSEPK
jgi:hypothetical protein